MIRHFVVWVLAIVAVGVAVTWYFNILAGLIVVLGALLILLWMDFVVDIEEID